MGAYILVTRWVLLQLMPVQPKHGLVPFAQPCQPLMTRSGTFVNDSLSVSSASAAAAAQSVPRVSATWLT